MTAPEPVTRRPGRRALVVAAVVAALVVGLAAAVPLAAPLWWSEDGRVTSGPGGGSRVALHGVVTYDDLRTDHVDGDVDYEHSPPPGGPHADVWLACGVYDEPVRDENMVHSLEHGTVWVTHLPGLPAEDVERLAVQLPQEGVLSPYPGQGAPVVVTVWGRQLELEGADDPRLPLFLGTYGDGRTSPEPLASCQDGRRSPGGGDTVEV